MTEQTLHIWFINGRLNGASVQEGSVRDVAREVIAKANSFDSTDVHPTSRTYPLGEPDSPVELVYEGAVTLDNGGAADWRHVFRRPDSEWSRLCTTYPPQTTATPE